MRRLPLHLSSALAALALILVTVLLPSQTVVADTTTVTARVASGADDGFSGSWGFFNRLTWCENGNPGKPYSAWYRFANVQVPDGATIVEAYLETTHGEWAQGTHLKIRADKSSTVSAPTSTRNHAGKPRTAAGVDWDAGYSDWQVHRSPNIAPVIQELVNTYSFAGGRAMQLLVDNDASSRRCEYVGGTLEDGSAPTLVIVYRAEAVSPPAPAGAVSVTVPAGLTEGSAGTAMVSVQNTGAAAATFSVTGTVSLAEQALATISWQPAVNAGAAATRDFAFSVPAGLSGTGKATVALTSDGAMLDADTVTFNVAAATPPAPTYSGTVSVAVSAGLTEASSGTSTVTVSNTGATATAFAVTGTVSVQEQVLATISWQPAVNAGATVTRSFTFTIPAGLSGTGEAGATLKANGTTLHADTVTFNVAAAPPPAPTYTGTVSVTVPSGLTEGSSGTATVTVRNTGSTATFAVTGAVSVEEEGLLAISWQPTVNAGATATRSFTFNIPAGVYGIGEATANMAVNGTILDEDQVTFTVAAAEVPPPAPPAGTVRLNMKSYGNHNAAYDARIIAMRPEFCIDNPAHGLYGEMYGYNDSSLLQDVASYQAAGIKVIGYITCGYEGGVGEDTGGDGYNSYWYSLDLQKKMIRNMATLDGVDGVFIDECSSYPGAASKAYLLELTSLAHSYGLIVWGNVGVDSFDEWFFTQGGFDFMQSSESWRGQALSSVQQKWGSRIAVTGYSKSYTAQQAYDLTVNAWSKGIRYCYINTVEYTSIAPWFETYVDMLRAAQSSY